MQKKIQQRLLFFIPSRRGKSCRAYVSKRSYCVTINNSYLIQKYLLLRSLKPLKRVKRQPRLLRLLTLMPLQVLRLQTSLFFSLIILYQQLVVVYKVYIQFLYILRCRVTLLFNQIFNTIVFILLFFYFLNFKLVILIYLILECFLQQCLQVYQFQ